MTTSKAPPGTAASENPIAQEGVEAALQRTFRDDLDGPREGRKSSLIMMVDDEPTTLDVLKMFLQGEGYENFVATTDSREALDLLKAENPDVVLMDLMMPHVNGLEILRSIRDDASLKHIPVLILTSSTDAETKLQALELGATDFLGKPVDPSELALRLRNTLADDGDRGSNRGHLSSDCGSSKGVGFILLPGRTTYPG